MEPLDPPPAPAVLEIGPRPSLRSWLSDLWEYRAVLSALARRDLRSRYRKAVLGVGWAVLQPLVQVGVFTLIFRGVARVDTPVPYPVFVLASLLPFNLFQQIVSQGTPSFANLHAVVSKVYFPRVFTVMAASASPLVNGAVTAGILAGLLAGFRVAVPASALLAIPLLLCMVLLSVGAAAMLAALNARFRDVQHVLPVALQVLLYVSPVLYPMDRLPEAGRMLASVNPVTGLVDGFRSCLLGTEPHSWGLVGAGAALSIALFAAGLLVFDRTQAALVDEM
ncbi:MAG: ABC transporter permease [Planctomycetaceae bacterium]|nr:ABC transporter permease [Planctomycetota bacterium]NUN52788.1 ABC transporter permease [Planctomycetaceae bacterium]